MIRRLVALLMLACMVLPARAHKPSDSYLTLNVGVQGRITGRWDIALRDLDYAIGLDANGDGAVTWGELRTRHADIAAYALARLAILADGQTCTITPGSQQVDDHTDGAYTVLLLSIACPHAPQRLAVTYTLFADLDPQHRGLLNLKAQKSTRTAVLGPQAPSQQFDLQRTSRLSQFTDYLREGVWHIWVGYDHILFLLSLLLPAALVMRNGAWRPAERLRQPLLDVVKIVTSFTVAHSITLSLATLGVVSLPSRWVESAIALSVVLAALNNVFPVFQGRRWLVAFCFGLIHGFGFAGVLQDLGLPQGALLLALVGFNLGVEAGQLAIVALFLPLAFSLRRTGFYRRAVFTGGSLVIALVAGVWLAERVFVFKLLPF
ncbi:MAG TPA: HupE/UreJ family protein [Burkholderiaceae bacterium]|nr:HupE/UreJ family protein [Burkholderiaceae bacterium]